ncbi:UvrB/uvrC motif protein [Aquisphaera giovannonii]|uniref:UvrB/uvrC motif protein n=1 Tax=Aquisphaera giovannonii TaxID=406548 RepID=A0A5B9W0L6_9BACT|nr:UvrB/UvrC motif-containing protein [Aquisphaera giovannonii]QEH34083.1 UvrB/uvrC motif protein [Aquisphaera giovannonii]
MGQDISSAIAGWDFTPDEFQARVIRGEDGRDKIQMRIDLGLLQMEVDGRPDGDRPHGFESLLEYHEDRLGRAEREGEEYALDHAECAQLMREGLQYYHRYLSAFHLRRYELVTRDTDRNLRLFAFVVRHASRRRDKAEFDQYRPYVLMMRSRALALTAIGRSDYPKALQEIDEGIAQIRQFLADYQRDDEAECAELGFLTRWRREVEQERPTGPVERLEQQLELAISLEDYEEAARIRDQIRQLRGPTIEESRRS